MLEWYVKNNVPVLDWEKTCYDKAYLNRDEFDILSAKISKIEPDSF